MNGNAQNAAGPLVLYDVNTDYTNFGGELSIRQIQYLFQISDTAEVYEADGMIRPVSTIPSSITVMSARPFTLKGAPLQGNLPQGIIATMSGYGDMDYAQCPYLYYVM